MVQEEPGEESVDRRHQRPGICGRTITRRVCVCFFLTRKRDDRIRRENFPLITAFRVRLVPDRRSRTTKIRPPPPIPKVTKPTVGCLRKYTRVFRPPSEDGINVRGNKRTEFFGVRRNK